jgi:hypothetical protein
MRLNARFLYDEKDVEKNFYKNITNIQVSFYISREKNRDVFMRFHA